MDYIKDCRSYFKRTYNRIYKKEIGTRTSQSAQTQSERNAQRKAMQLTLTYGIRKYHPGITVKEIWAAVRKSHIQRKMGASFGKRVLLDDSLVDQIVAAHQSWDKASGHAFEEYIPEVLNTILNSRHINVVLQKELTALLNASPCAISNNATEIDWLKEQVNRDVFDLYAIQELNGDKYVFGCLQSKTSIRDRVTRDREPSQQAMKKRFWSVGVTLDGDFFKNEKFQDMVNGGTADYSQNGWHGMYVIESPYYGGRIFDFEVFVAHAEKAARAWINNHEALINTWNPND